MKPGYMRWKFNLQQRAQDSEISTAQTDADTGIADAATAQADVDDLELVVTTVQDSAEAQTEALASAAGQVNAPTFFFAGSPLIVGFYTTTGSSTIYYRINGSGGWSTYSSPVTITISDYIEAYATAAGLTDSGITRYDA